MAEISLPSPSASGRSRRIAWPKMRTVAVTAVVAALAAAMMRLSQPVALQVDGQRMVSDVPPVTTEREAFVPLRLVAASLGAVTEYDPRSGTIVVIRGDRTLRLRIGERGATLDGMPMTLTHPPFEVRGRAMVALNTFSRAFGTKVRYDGARAKIDVVSPGLVEAGAQSDAP
ncbi:MAG: copper amine oxidase N-terminal domain-containing protein [Vulcanimicrobiaceae bacterium]